ncbi:Uncharacterised protein [Shigella sonnei]|nr:Uncharacterised protein [Shigella sonnei]
MGAALHQWLNALAEGFDSRQKIIEGQQHAFGTRHACDFI